MADVVISYAPEDEATARQLGEALARRGYEIWLPKGGSGAGNSDSVTERIVGAKAVAVIWSSAAAASEWVRAEANIARGLKKLVQASADGNPPPIPFDAAQVASISTWLGDDDHPGWAAVLARVAVLAGTPEPAPEPEPEPTPESLSDPVPSLLADPRPAASPASAVSLSAPARHRGPGLALVMMILFVLIVLGAVAYIFWQRSQLPPATPVIAETNAIAPAEPAGPDLPQDVPLQQGEAPAPPANETFDRQAVLRGGGPAAVRSAPTAQGVAVGQIQPGEAFQTYQQAGDWWRVRTASGVTGYVMASAIQLGNAAAPAKEPRTAPPVQPQSRPVPQQRRPEPRPPRQRIRKENSEAMVEFCDGAGRNTPQCRRFRQSY